MMGNAQAVPLPDTVSHVHKCGSLWPGISWGKKKHKDAWRGEWFEAEISCVDWVGFRGRPKDRDRAQQGVG
jgi:hypothetical protein